MTVVCVIVFTDRRMYLNLSKSIQSTAGLRALKPAANGRYFMCKSLPYYLAYIYCTEARLSFSDYINENFENACECMDLYLREGGSKPEYPEKPHDNQSDSRYPNLLEVEIHRRNQPLPSKLRSIRLVRTRQPVELLDAANMKKYEQESDDPL